MSKTVPPKVEIKPVAWAGEVVTKYQGFVTVTRPNGTEKVMTGEPMSTQAAAKQSLKYEIMERQGDISQALDALKEIM